MGDKKYLYYYERYGKQLYRVEISRETNSNVWIKYSNGSEEKIPKKTYRTGSGFRCSYYYKETLELLQEFKEHNFKRLFLKKLDELKKCENFEIMKKVIEL